MFYTFIFIIDLYYKHLGIYSNLFSIYESHFSTKLENLGDFRDRVTKYIVIHIGLNMDYKEVHTIYHH